jgi:cytochrome c
MPIIFSRGVAAAILAATLATSPVMAAPDGSGSADRGTPEQARAMLDRAVAHWLTVGRDQALKDFSAPPADEFGDRDLYVSCLAQGGMTAHGMNRSLIGRPLASFVDANGSAFAQEMVTQGLQNGQAQVNYIWQNPVTRRPETKSSFVQKVGDDEVCLVGFFTPTNN